MFRRIPHDVKIEAIRECLRGKSFNEVAEKYDISESTLRREYKKVIARVDLIIPGGPMDEAKKKLKELKKRFFRR